GGRQRCPLPPPPPLPPPLLLGRGDDLAALVRALLLGLGRDPALALAAVLSAAAVLAAGAASSTLAGVDPRAVHVATSLLVPLVSCLGGGGKHRAHRRRH